jgi:hypothetical protein
MPYGYIWYSTIPHVGGPISLGDTGVFIGGKTAARIGDMAVCVGPPSSIIMGCPTVLIGKAGGGGGNAAVGAAISASIAGTEPQAETLEEHYLDVPFLDKSNTPMGGE